MGCHFLLQGIFPTHRLNPHLLCLLHCRPILYLLSHQQSPAEAPLPLCNFHIFMLFYTMGPFLHETLGIRALILQSSKFSSYFPFFCSSHGHGFGESHSFSSRSALILNTLLKSVLRVRDHRSGQLSKDLGVASLLTGGLSLYFNQN